MPLTETQLLRRLRAWTAFFIFGLVVSGLTAIPLETELAVLERLAGQGTEGFAGWIHRVAEALRETNAKFPFLAYGTDWLAFGMWSSPSRSSARGATRCGTSGCSSLG